MVHITIKTDNDAFTQEAGGACGVEIARILRDLAKRIDGNPNAEADGYTNCLHDVNGNEVGWYSVGRA